MHNLFGILILDKKHIMGHGFAALCSNFLTFFIFLFRKLFKLVTAFFFW